MKTLLFVAVLAALSAAPALATPSPCAAAVGCNVRAAPAPLLGAGIPSAIAIGGALLGVTFWRRKKN